ncbi:MAG: rhodanese-like domain-containing protein [Terrimicrobiaceae bacterium]|nr:rhodanese-like domain-containing protein [Terrimicrobiaceae bacterium]
MKRIDASDLVGVMADVVLLDVRGPGEYASEHIMGSRLEPLSALDAAGLARELAGRRCVVICQGGTRANQAAKELQSAGLQDLEVLEGGLNAWKAAGHPVVEGERKVLPLDRQMRILIGSLVVLGVVLGIWIHPAWLALPAFLGCGMVFAGFTDLCPLANAMARMPWNTRGSAGQMKCEMDNRPQAGIRNSE